MTAITFDVDYVSQPLDFGVTYLLLIPLEMMRTRATGLVPELVCLAGRTVSPCPHFVGRLVRRESTTVCGFSLPINPYPESTLFVRMTQLLAFNIGTPFKIVQSRVTVFYFNP